MMYSLFFFFQAEDGIRDVAVTGVQTCALPICRACGRPREARRAPWQGCGDWWRVWWCRGCPARRTASGRRTTRRRRGAVPSTGHARGRRLRRPVLSPLFERVRKRLGGPFGGIHHVVHDRFGFLHIMRGGFVDVLVDRPVLGVGPAARILAAQNAIIDPRFDPALELSGAQRVEGMRLIERVENLEDAIDGAAALLVLFSLSQ